MPKVNKIVTPNSMEFVVTYPTATRLYGAWSVAYPDGVSLSEDQRKRSVYVYALENDLGNGLFIQAFLKSDISINIPAGITDIAQVIDGAEKANEMTTTFVRDIEGLEVGTAADVSPGDVVDVMVGPGMFREAKVSGVEFVATPTGVVRKIKISKDILNRNEKLLKHQSDTWLRIIDGRKREGANLTALEAYMKSKFGVDLVYDFEFKYPNMGSMDTKYEVTIGHGKIGDELTLTVDCKAKKKHPWGRMIVVLQDADTGETYSNTRLSLRSDVFWKCFATGWTGAPQNVKNGRCYLFFKATDD